MKNQHDNVEFAQSFAQEYSAFEGSELVAGGSLTEVITGVMARLKDRSSDEFRIFDDHSGKLVEVNYRGSLTEVLSRLTPKSSSAGTEETFKPAGPGRPKLGVVSREISLLPRHWEWLASQPGGASVSIRKLVEAARRENAGPQTLRESQEAAYRFMHAMAGDLPGYEEALRAMYTKNKSKFEASMEKWPKDLREHALKLSKSAF